MTRAAIYARRSTSLQDDSLAQQVADCERLIGERGWEMGEVYADTASGWKPDTPRPSFDRMVKDAGRSFQVLVVWEISRLSRQDDDRSALSIVWQLRGRGVEVHSIHEVSTGNKLADDLSLLIKSHTAKAASDDTSARVTRGKRHGVLNGVHQGRWAPYGYLDARDSDGRWIGGTLPSPTKAGRTVLMHEIDERQAAAVREVFWWFVKEGRSPQEIADELNRGQVPPPRPESYHRLKRRGEPTWHQSTLRDLISNPLLAGFASYHGRRLKACACADIGDEATWSGWVSCEHGWVRSINVPALVDPALWERAQAVLETRSRGREARSGATNHGGVGRFLLAGLVWCGECGERIGTRTAQRPTLTDRYVCRNRRLGRRCHLPTIPRDLLDEAVRESFVRQFVDAVDVQATIERERERLLAMRDSEAAIVRDEMVQVQKTLDQARALSLKARKDWEAGDLSSKLWTELDADYSLAIEHAEDALARLEDKLAAVETQLSTPQIDALLDRLSIVKRTIEGSLTAQETPLLNLQLAEVFDAFVITAESNRVYAQPRLKRAWRPENASGRPSPRVFDFGVLDPHEGKGLDVRVPVEYPPALLKKVDLTRGIVGDDVNDNL